MNEDYTSAKVLLSSVSPDGEVITTLKIKCTMFTWRQFLTHRTMSRNAQSGRASRSTTFISSVEGEPFFPSEWRHAQKGMQPGELMNDHDADQAQLIWRSAFDNMIDASLELSKLGVAKEHVNRLLEPFAYVQAIITATEWDNFFNLRLHGDAQKEIQVLASKIHTAMKESTPQRVEYGEWHAPQTAPLPDELNQWQRLDGSAAQMAIVSYLGPKAHSVNGLLHLAGNLKVDEHMSPFEHQATPHRTGMANFVGWQSYRSVMENTCD